MCCRLGRYADGKFDLDAADGPHALDLGDVLYAPNLLEDAQVRGGRDTQKKKSDMQQGQ
jgi:hypothetical protein